MSQYIIIGDGYTQMNTNYYLCTDGYNSFASNYLILGQGGNYVSPNPPSFLPTNLTNLALWLRADLGISLNGSNVSAWADQSGNNNNFTQSTSGNQPPYNLTGINSLPSIDTSALLSGHSTYLQCVNAMNTILTGTAAERFVVINPNSAATQPGQGQIFGGWGSGDTGSYAPFVDGKIYDGFAQTTRPEIGICPIEPFILDTQSASGNFTELANTSTLYTTSTNTFGSGTAQPLIFGDPTLNYWNGQMSEVIVYNRVLSSSERTQVITYLSTRYGIAV